MGREIKLKDYEGIVGHEALDELSMLADKIKGKRFLNINSTRTGGGVAEILARLVPLLNELGVETRWEVMEGSPEFFEVTKAFHNALQGQPIKITQDMLDSYIICNYENVHKLNFDSDMVVIHDPQPAAMVRYRKKGQSWIWRCHIDLSNPQRELWEYLKVYVDRYAAAVFSMAKFAQRLEIPQFIITPSIDPLSDKNRELSQDEIDQVLDDFQILRDKPIITQISRFDRFKDPLGVISAFRLVRRHTDCRLILAGGGADDDPEGAQVLQQVREAAEGDADMHVLELAPGSDLAVNALQRASAIIIQKSIKEGFGLTVTEAMWKGKPVVGGAAGGILLQIQNGFTGFVVHSVEGAAYRLRYLLSRPNLMKQLGENGREYVRRNFLITQGLRDYLLMAIVLGHPGQRQIMI